MISKTVIAALWATVAIATPLNPRQQSCSVDILHPDVPTGCPEGAVCLTSTFGLISHGACQFLSNDPSAPRSIVVPEEKKSVPEPALNECQERPACTTGCPEGTVCLANAFCYSPSEFGIDPLA